MAFTKKHTYTIVVQGDTYSWHRSRRFEWHNRWTAIRKKDSEGQLLLLDPYHHDFTLGAGDVAKAIAFALGHGWTPERKGKPMKLRYNGDDFDGEPFTQLPSRTQLSDR